MREQERGVLYDSIIVSIYNRYYSMIVEVEEVSKCRGNELLEFIGTGIKKPPYYFT